MYRIDEVLKRAGRVESATPNVEKIVARGKRRILVERSLTGTLSISLLVVGFLLLPPGGDDSQEVGPEPASAQREGIVFGAMEGGEPESDLFVIDPATGRREKVFDRANGGEQTPAWSPDGRRIALGMNYVPGGPQTVDANIELALIDADGTNPVRLTDHEGLDRTPSWSPDGDRLAYFTATDPIREYDGGGQGSNGIWVMAADGSDRHQISSGDGLATFPAWSPKGDEIAFVQFGPGGESEIAVMSPEGSDVRRLTDFNGEVFGPEWSPDGKSVGFVGVTEDETRGIYAIDTQSGRTTRLFELGSKPGATTLAWSPTGHEIAYPVYRKDAAAIWILDIETGKTRELVGGFASLWGLDWR